MRETIATYTHNSVTGTLEKVDGRWVITVKFHAVLILTEEYSDEDRAISNWAKLIIDPRFFVPKAN